MCMEWSEKLVKEPIKLRFRDKDENPEYSLTIKQEVAKIWDIIGD